MASFDSTRFNSKLRFQPCNRRLGRVLAWFGLSCMGLNLRPMCMKKLLLCCAVVSLLGCSGGGVLLAPKHPLTTLGKNKTLRSDLYPPTRVADYRHMYEQAQNEAERKRCRNEVVQRLMAETDNNFLIWSQRVYGTRIIGETGADVTNTVLNTVAVGSGASSAKSIAVALASLAGVRLATNENLFMKQNASALYAKMKEHRAAVATQIEGHLKDKDTTTYPLNAALRDVERYYEAGTMAYASAHLSAEANQKAAVAEAVREQAKGDEIIAPNIIRNHGVYNLSSPPPPRVRPDDEIGTGQAAAAIEAARRKAEREGMIGKIKKINSEADETFLVLRETNPDMKRDYADLIVAGGGKVAAATDSTKGEYINNAKGVNQLLTDKAGDETALVHIHSAALKRQAALKAKLPQALPTPAPTPAPTPGDIN
jgi:hypothetical protein